MFLVYAACGIMSGTMVAVIGLILFYLVNDANTETRNFTSAIADATDDSIFVLGRDYRYCFINKNHLARIGIKEGEYQGRSYADFHPEETTREFTAIVERVFTTGKQIVHEHKSERDGEYYLLTLSPVREADGTLAAVTVHSTKITGIKRLEEKVSSLTRRDDFRVTYDFGI